MSLRFCDSFDHYQTGNLEEKWNSTAGVSISTGGRNGNCVGGNGVLTKDLDSQGTWIVGFAAKLIGNANTASTVYSLNALGTNGALVNIANVIHNADNTLAVTTPSGTIGTSPPYDWDGFHYIECKVVLSGTATITASCTLRVNTETVVTGALGVGAGSTQIAAGAAKANVHTFSSAASGFIDDLYINDGNGSSNNDFMGDVKVRVIRPNGDNTVQWTGTGSSTGTHYLNVNGTGEPDDDTSYVYSTETGSMELYDWEDISAFTGTIKGVQYSVYARKDDEGARVIQLLEGTTGTNTLTNAITGKVDVYLNDAYDYHHVALDTSPTTGTAWTVTDFNADRFGYKIGTNT